MKLYIYYVRKVLIFIVGIMWWYFIIKILKFCNKLVIDYLFYILYIVINRWLNIVFLILISLIKNIGNFVVFF